MVERRNIVIGGVLSLLVLFLMFVWHYRPQDPLKPLIDATGVAFPVIIAKYGENCYEACKRVDLRCDAHYFNMINNCDGLRQVFGDPNQECGEVEGYDLPAYDSHFKRLHVSKRNSPYRTSCGGFHANTRRACPCSERTPVEVKRSVHVVYNAEAGHYMRWQALYMDHWFKQVDWPNAKLTRLLTGYGCDDLCDEPFNIATHVAPPYNYTRDHYKPYNKPLAIMHWLAEAKPTEDVIIVLDPDCLINRPIDFQELVRKNEPIAQKAFFTFTEGSVDKQIIDRYQALTGKFCEFPEPLAVPYIMLREDMIRIAPLWLKWTEVVRSDADGWEPEWADMPGVPWIAEMLGYVLASCELGYQHQIWPELQLVPGVNWTSLGNPEPPILHYHTPVWVNGYKWVKYPSDAATNFPWPIDEVWPDAPPVERKFFHKFYNASKTIFNLPDDNFRWQGTDKEFKNKK